MGTVAWNTRSSTAYEKDIGKNPVSTTGSGGLRQKKSRMCGSQEFNREASNDSTGAKSSNPASLD